MPDKNSLPVDDFFVFVDFRFRSPRGKFEEKLIWIFRFVGFVFLVVGGIICYFFANIFDFLLFNLEVLVQKVTFGKKVQNIEIVLIKEGKIFRRVKGQKVIFFELLVLFDHLDKNFVHILVLFVQI